MLMATVVPRTLSGTIAAITVLVFTKESGCSFIGADGNTDYVTTIRHLLGKAEA